MSRPYGLCTRSVGTVSKHGVVYTDICLGFTFTLSIQQTFWKNSNYVYGGIWKHNIQHSGVSALCHLTTEAAQLESPIYRYYVILENTTILRHVYLVQICPLLYLICCVIKEFCQLCNCAQAVIAHVKTSTTPQTGEFKQHFCFDWTKTRVLWC